MPKLTDTQTILLSTATNRADSLLRRGMISMVITDVAETMWKRGAAEWDQDAGHGTGLVISPAGLAALGIESLASNSGANLAPSDATGSEATETAVPASQEANRAVV